MRIGLGYDLHRLVAGRPLMIGGVRIPFERGLTGHSDADVLAHATADALLGAAGLPDLGQLFPDTDPQWKDASGETILRRVTKLTREAGYRVSNLDAVLIAEQPKFGPHRVAIRARLAELIEVEPEQVNVKAKTAERIGAIGAGEAIAAQVVVLLQRAE